MGATWNAAPRSAPEATSTAPTHSGAPHVDADWPDAARDGMSTRAFGGSSPPAVGAPPAVAIGPPLSGMRGDLPDTSTVVSGTASWYCGAGSRCTVGYPASGLYAAAGPALRIGDWRGRIVTVRSGTRTVRVRLVDWCFCGGGRVVDLYRVAFARLADPSLGVIRVEVSWGDGAVATLPPTSTLEGTQ